MAQARAASRKDGTEPVVILVQKGKPIGEALVIRRLADFAEVEK